MTSFNFVPQPPDLPSQVPAMVWHLDSQKADHYSGGGGEDSGRMIVVAETVMVVAVAMVLLMPMVASCSLGWAWLQVPGKDSWFSCLWFRQALNNPSNTFFFYLSEPELVSISCNQEPWAIQWNRERFIFCSFFSFSLFSVFTYL